MDIIGSGMDAMEIQRIADSLERYGDRFLRHVFTEGEIAYCRRKRDFASSFAARFAAKEAAMKALGTGWANGIGWRDFEVVHGADGRPTLALHGKASALARRRGMRRWLLALSHDGGAAVASVVVEVAPRVRETAGPEGAGRRRGAVAAR